MPGIKRLALGDTSYEPFYLPALTLTRYVDYIYTLAGIL